MADEVIGLLRVVVGAGVGFVACGRAAWCRCRCAVVSRVPV